MNIEWFREYCLSKPGAEETFPFGEDTLVFKVMGKMFALTSLSQPDRANLKCDPEKAIALRASFSGVEPGWHMSKVHWNTVHFHMDISDPEILELIDGSYDLVVQGLTKKMQSSLNALPKKR